MTIRPPLLLLTLAPLALLLAALIGLPILQAATTPPSPERPPPHMCIPFGYGTCTAC